MAKWDSDDRVLDYMTRVNIGFRGLRRNIEKGLLGRQKAEYALEFIARHEESEEQRQRDLDNQFTLRQTLAAEEAVREAVRANERADRANWFAGLAVGISIVAAIATIAQAYFAREAIPKAATEQVKR